MLFSRRMSKKDAKEEKEKQLLPLSEKVAEALAMEVGEVSFGALKDMGATLMHALSEVSIFLFGERDGDIVNSRLLSPTPETLRSLGERHGISHERVRQVVARANKNYHRFLKQGTRQGSFYARDCLIPILLESPSECFIPVMALSLHKCEFARSILVEFTTPKENADAYLEALRQSEEKIKRKMLSSPDGTAYHVTEHVMPPESAIVQETPTSAQEGEKTKEKRALTEVEKIAYAKLFIDKMAMGQNPIDNTPIPEGDTLNQVRISRCLFYVSGILGQVIELGGIPPVPPPIQAEERKKEKTIPFHLTREQIEEISLSEDAVSASVILEKLNALCPQNMKKLSPNKFYDWLLSLGVYEKTRGEDGMTHRAVTPFGAEIGVSLEMRNGQYGPHAVIVYSKEAQAFIFDNIEGLFEYLEGLTRGGKYWKPEEEELLVSYFTQGKPIHEIARALSRTNGAVRHRLKTLGVIK